MSTGGATVGVGGVVGVDAFEIFKNANLRRILRRGGGVWIEAGDTVLAKSTLLWATFAGLMRIRRNAMLDKAVDVADNDDIGERPSVVACAEISGRCELGKGACIRPNATIINGMKIGTGATVSMRTAVMRDVPDGSTISGNFVVHHAQWLAFVKNLSKREPEPRTTL